MLTVRLNTMELVGIDTNNPVYRMIVVMGTARG